MKPPYLILAMQTEAFLSNNGIYHSNRIYSNEKISALGILKVTTPTQESELYSFNYFWDYLRPVFHLIQTIIIDEC